MFKMPKNMDDVKDLAKEVSGKVLDKLSEVCKNLSEKATAATKHAEQPVKPAPVESPKKDEEKSPEPPAAS